VSQSSLWRKDRRPRRAWIAQHTTIDLMRRLTSSSRAQDHSRTPQNSIPSSSLGSSLRRSDEPGNGRGTATGGGESLNEHRPGNLSYRSTPPWRARDSTSCSSDANTLHVICHLSNANDIMWPLLTTFSPVLTSFGSSANNLAMAINVTALVVRFSRLLATTYHVTLQAYI
jgi:hypothetical protein